MNQKGFAPILLLIIVLVLIFSGGYFYYYVNNCIASPTLNLPALDRNSNNIIGESRPPLCRIASLIPAGGTGGVTITRTQETTDYQYNGLTVTSTAFDASYSATPVIWKSYSYPNSNISFNLPSDWSIKSQKTSEPYVNLKGPEELIIYGPKNEAEFKIYYFNNPQSLTPQEFEEKNNIPQKSFVPPAKVRPFSEDEIIGGVKGINGTLLCEQDYNICHALPYNSRIYMIDLNLNVTAQWDTLQYILSTIKFN
jgi:hypothetical protein